MNAPYYQNLSTIFLTFAHVLVFVVKFVRAPVRSVSYDGGEQFSAIGTVIVVMPTSNEGN